MEAPDRSCIVLLFLLPPEGASTYASRGMGNPGEESLDRPLRLEAGEALAGSRSDQSRRGSDWGAPHETDRDINGDGIRKVQEVALARQGLAAAKGLVRQKIATT